MFRIASAAIALGLSGGAALAQDSVEERQFWAAAFEAGRVYAQDMTLISYCVRNDDDLAAYAPVTLVSDLDHVAERARTGAVSARRVGEFIREVLTSTRLATREASDPALDQQCAERKVAEEVLKLGSIARPLSMRPPFAKP
jgi:hypothetical protein